MTAEYPTDTAPATPEYVLDVLEELLGNQWEDLTFDLSVVDLLGMYDDLAWPSTRLLAEVLNAAFRVDIPLTEWERAFPGVRGRTVSEVCDFLAARITRPVIRPWNHVAGSCRPAGAFLTVRSILAERGFDPARITPSAPLDGLPREEVELLFWRLALIAPGRIPEVTYVFRPCLFGCGLAMARIPAGIVLLFALVWLVCAVLALHPTMILLSSVLLSVAYKTIRWVDRFAGPVGTLLGELRTFRDLAYCLAGQPPRRRRPRPTA